MVKDMLANNKAINGTKVSFTERHVTAEEDKRVSMMEDKIDKLCSVILGKRPTTPDPRQRRDSRSPDRQQG